MVYKEFDSENFLEDWGEIKFYSVDMPIYFMSNFTDKKSDMSVIKPITDDRGFCLINAEIAKDLGDSYENTVRTSVTAMIDSGASRSGISSRMTEKLQLEKKHGVKVIGVKNETTSMAFFHLFIPELSTDNSVPLHGFINNKIQDRGFDLIIGCDYLAHVKFERDGKARTFTLTIE